MEFRRIWILRGPNLWAPIPVIEAELELREHDAFRPGLDPAFRNHLAAWLPAAENLEENANLANALLLATLHLQELVDSDAHFGKVHRTTEPAFYRVIFAFDEEALGRACLETGRKLCLAALRGEHFDLPAKLEELRHLAHEVRLGPSTGAIVRAAKHRGIPTHRLTSGSLVQLGQGARLKRIWTAETEQTSAIGELVAQDKQLTRSLLEAIGVPMPWGRPVTSAEDAWAAAQEIGPPVVVKPQYGNQGRGVATDLTTEEQVVNAYAAAKEISGYLMVEKFVPGSDHRLLVVGDHLVAASLRESAHVIGDGQSTVAELIAEVNRDPRRSDGHATSLSFIKLDPVSLAVLSEQGYSPDSIPGSETRVVIRRNANLSTGGTATDVTDCVHPEVAACAVAAAKAVGLDVAGVDIVALDISQPLDTQGGAIVEVNAGPGLRMHLEPSAGKPRLVGDAIVASLFPAGQTGRIPVVAVTGVNGKTTTTRLVSHILRQSGKYVGMTCTDGIYLDGRRTETRDCSGPQSARTILMNPRVEAAVLETARGGILREGLGFDHCDVAIVTNVGKGDHLGLRGIDSVEGLARVKCVVVKAVAPEGTAVLNAADPLVAAMAPECPGRVIFFARDPGNAELAAHRADGGRAVLVREGQLVLAEGSQEEALLPVADMPFTHGGVGFQVENALAAAAALWALGLPLAQLKEGLRTFTGDADSVPGRFNVLQAGPGTVIVDYAHNPSAVEALVAGLDRFPQRRRTLVFSGCNRRDIDVREMGELAGRGFDRVFLYADWGHSGRADGELNAILREGLQAGGRVSEIVELPDERTAIDAALAGTAVGELVVLGVESIEESLAYVRQHLGDFIPSTP